MALNKNRMRWNITGASSMCVFILAAALIFRREKS